MIKDSEMTWETMKAWARGGKCRCGGGLSVAYGGAFGYPGYILRCGKDSEHSDFELPKRTSPYDLPPGVWPYPLKRKQRRFEGMAETGNKLAKYERKGQLTKAEATEILKACWPGAPELQVFKAAGICAAYRLNPLMGHVFLIPFKKKDRDGKVIGVEWVVVLSAKTDWLLATRRGPISYVSATPRVMTTEEQTTTFGRVDTDRLWVVVQLRDPKTGAEVVGYGFWLNKDQPYGSDKGNTAFNMARIRADRQALQRLRPGEMPDDVGVIDAEYQQVDTDTGEIAEASESPPAIVAEDESLEATSSIEAATPEQVDRIKALANEKGWRMGDLGDYSRKQGWQAKTVRELTSSQAAQLIEAIAASNAP